MVKDLKKKVKDLEFKPVKAPSWYNYQIEIAFDEEKNEYYKKRNNNSKKINLNPKKGDHFYYRLGKEFRCLDCDSIINSYSIYHPVERNFALNFNLKTQVETVPYCPNCEKLPDKQGRPIISVNEPD